MLDVHANDPEALPPGRVGEELEGLEDTTHDVRCELDALDRVDASEESLEGHAGALRVGEGASEVGGLARVHGLEGRREGHGERSGDGWRMEVRGRAS